MLTGLRGPPGGRLEPSWGHWEEDGAAGPLVSSPRVTSPGAAPPPSPAVAEGLGLSEGHQVSTACGTLWPEPSQAAWQTGLWPAHTCRHRAPHPPLALEGPEGALSPAALAQTPPTAVFGETRVSISAFGSPRAHVAETCPLRRAHRLCCCSVDGQGAVCGR